MKTLIGVTTCHWRKQCAESQQQTWAKDSPVDVRFFYGGESPTGENNTGLGCRDDYKGLPEKVQAACQWALNNGYERFCKIDDDVYFRPERLINVTGDYVGLYREPFFKGPAGYCSGFAYLLSKEALEIVANASKPDLEQEDLWVANTLYSRGIVGKTDPRFVITCGRNMLIPTAFNNLIAAAEFKDMTEPHSRWVESLAEWEETVNALLV